jgi:anti-sigma factor RsiW
MSCENYRETLTEAAATNAGLSSELHSHLDGCASCRAAFAEERQLFAAVDAGLRAHANADVPASLLPGVRAKLNERSIPRRSWIPAFAAITAAAALVIGIVFVRGVGRGDSEQNLRTTAVARSVVPPETKTVPAAVPHVETSAPPTKGKLRRPLRIAPVASVEEVAVLIPAGQKKAIDALLTSVQHGEVMADVLRAEKPEIPLAELEVSPLAISPIEIKPLEDESAEPASRNEKTHL